MPSFRSSENQAAYWAKYAARQVRGDGKDKFGTERSYRQCMKTASNWMKENGHTQGLGKMTADLARAYLSERAEVVSQTTLDQERQSLQHLPEVGGLERIHSEVDDGELCQVSRAYTHDQSEVIAEHQLEHNAISTDIVDCSGVRSHELLNIQRIEEREPDDRNWRDHRFEGREDWARYTVQGKGGLVREIRVAPDVAARLEERRLEEPRIVEDRGIRWVQYYDIGGGQSWSQSFSDASERCFGWSRGGHGLRHTYAQERVGELQARGYSFRDACAAVSQEMGHHDPNAILAYLR